MVNNVKKIREKLAIESWDKITYDQYKELIKIISNIDKETVKYIFEQIPQLFQMSEDLLITLKETLSHAKDMVIEDRRIIEKQMDACLEIIKDKEMDKATTDKFTDIYIDLLNRHGEMALDSNKNFIEISKETMKKVAVGAGMASIATILGVMLSKNKNQQTDKVIEADYQELAIDEEI